MGRFGVMGKMGGSREKNSYTFYSHPTSKTKTKTGGSGFLFVVGMTGFDESFVNGIWKTV